MPSTQTTRLSGLSTSLAVKAPCKAIATANITLSGEQTVNSVAVVVGDRVLATAQTSGVDNGIYVVSASGWARAKDFDGNRDVVTGTMVLVKPGTAEEQFWIVATTGAIVIGTTAITFEQHTPEELALRADLASTSAGKGQDMVAFVRTAAEIAASVTPTNAIYPPGNVRRYGAVMDGSTNDAAAWASADLQAAQGGAPIIVPRSSLGMGTASALTTDYRSDVVFEPGAFIKYTGSANITILTIGGTSSNPAFTRRYERLFVTRTTSDWTNEGAIGIKFLAVYGSHVDIAQVNGCTIGVQTLPNAAGFVYNEVYLGQLYNNKIDLDLSNVSGGWTNENNWYGGRFTVFDGINTGVARYAVRVTSSDGVYVANNNNHFWKPSFEKNAPNASAEAVCVLMTHGVQNHFHEVRDEGNDTPFAREANASTENRYDIGYSSTVAPPVIESTSTSPVFVAHAARGRHFDSPARLLFSSGAMHKFASYYDGATNVHVPNVSQADPGSATVFSNQSGITFNTNYLDFGTGLRGPSIFVDTSVVKQFMLSKDIEPGRGGRVIVNCYDAAGAIISTAGSVKGSSAQAFSSTTNYGNAFTTGSDSDSDSFFTVTAAVKSIRVSLCGGDASIRIRSFTIRSINHHAHASTWTGYEEIIPGASIGTAAPTAGTWARGKSVYHAAPAASTTQGWVCVTAGTPGTWKAMAVLAA